MYNILGLERSDFETALSEQGISTSHVKSIFSGIYREMLDHPLRRRGLPAGLEDSFQGHWVLQSPKIKHEYHSSYDLSSKFVLELEDGSQVETVLMPEKGRMTLCLSSQVGCQRRCAFCHTGRMGLRRNLKAAEIVGQVYALNRWLENNPRDFQSFGINPGARVSNVVFMGMGEPMDNVEEVEKAVKILVDHYGLGLAQKRVTVSTAGHLEGLGRMLGSFPRISLAISLHAPNQSDRARLMPISKRWTFEEILAFVREYTEDSGRFVFIQYVLIAGVNDSIKDANQLADSLHGLKVKVNLIPFNDVEPSSFRGPNPEQLFSFGNTLMERGIRVLTRFSKGQDIQAACGQLVNS